MSFLSKKILLSGLTLLLLQGCMSDKSFIDDRFSDAWHLSGKIGIAYPDNNCQRDYCPPRSEQGSIDWQQIKQAYTIKLSDPFGREVIAITGDAKQLVANSPGTETIQTTPQQFMALLVGKSKQKAILSTLIPQDLRYWVTGRPVPKVPHTESDTNRFVQKGFTISGRQWRDTTVGKMPALVVVEQGEFKLRIVIKDWEKVTQ